MSPREKMMPPLPPTNQTPWERMVEFTKRLLTVPKSELPESRKTKKRKHPKL